MSIASPFLNLASASGNTNEVTDASDRNPQDGEPAISRKGQERSISALVADAEQSDRFEIASALRDWGYRTSEASTMVEAISIIHAERPLVVIVSLELPDGSGLDAVNKIRHNYPEIVAIITGEGIPDEIVRHKYLAFLKKPIDKSHLRNILRRVLSGTAASRELPQSVRAQRRGRPQGKTVSSLGRLILREMKLLGLSYNDIVTASTQLAVDCSNSDMRIGKSTLGNIISGGIRQPGSAKLNSLRIILHLSRAEIDAAIGLYPERRLSEQLEMRGDRTHEITRDVVTRQRKMKIPILRKDATLKETGFLTGLMHKWAEVEVEYLGTFYPPHLIYIVVGERDTYSAPVVPSGSRLLVNTLLTEVRSAQNVSFHERELFCVSTPQGLTCAYLEQSPGKIILVPHPLSGHVREEFSDKQVTIIGQVVGIMFRRPMQ